MQRTTRWVTIALALAAAVSWLVFSVLPGFVAIFSYPAVQIPMAITLSAAACFGWLLLWLSERRGDGEMRCRRCGYILRGLSEPRCPECGERI